MKFLIVGLNAAPEPTGIAVYTMGLAESLVKAGHEVHQISGYPHYPYWKKFSGYNYARWTRNNENGVVITRCPTYVPRNLSLFRRILHYLSFMISSSLVVAWISVRYRPDLVINIAPSILSAPIGMIMSKIIGAKSQLHVQDFELEAAFALSGLKARGILAKFLGFIIDKTVVAHDFVTTISPQMVERVIVKGKPPSDCYELRNWAELDSVGNGDPSVFRDLWSIKEKNVVLYSGSIGAKQGLEVLVKTARLLKSRVDLIFIVCGNGPYRNELEQLAAGLDNIRFFDLQSFSDLGNLLSFATLHVIPQKKDAADLLFPSKLTNVFASGRPVVVGAQMDTALAKEVNGCGLVFEPEDSESLATNIIKIIDDPRLQLEMSRQAQARAHSHWAKHSIIAKYLDWLSHKGV